MSFGTLLTYWHFPREGEATYIAVQDGNTGKPGAVCANGKGDVNEAGSVVRAGNLACALQHFAASVSRMGSRMEQAPAQHSAAAAPGPVMPHPHRPRRAPTECGDLPFLIKRDGTWLYRGTAIGRKELVCLFASVLKRDEDGSFWLETPAERGRIAVEDVPFVAVELDWTGDGRRQLLSFRTNVDQVVTAGPEHPIRVAHDILTCDPTPYIRIRPGAGQPAIEARINRAVYYELVALGVPEWVGCRRMLGVWSSGVFFPLGELSPGQG